MKYFSLVVLGLWLTAAHSAVAEDVVLSSGEKSIKASIGDDVFAVYQFSKDRKKPFLLPVTGPGGLAALKAASGDAPEGTAGRRVIVCSESAPLKVFSQTTGTAALGDVLEVKNVQGSWLWIPDRNGWIHIRDVAPLASTVTRLINDNPPKIKDRSSPLYYDHPHHKGVWVSVDEVNDIKFWNEDGVIVSESVEVVTAHGNPAVLKRVNHWLGEDGAPLVRETALISLFANRLMTFDITFEPMIESVTFDDTKEGMFGIRLPNSMREMVSGGPVVNEEGVTGTGALWGKASRWIDYRGPIDGNVFGVTLMDHPGNPRPSRYHVRNYGLFSINPFGVEAYTKGTDDAQPADPLALGTGQSVRFRYGLFVHGDGTTAPEIEQAYEQFVNHE